jgi:hypothetical protein
MAYLDITEAQEQVGVPRSSMRVSIPPRRYSSHVALASSTCEPTNCFEEVGVMPWWRSVMDG